MKRTRDSRLHHSQDTNAVVKCEICGDEQKVIVFHCMREGWPKCCKQTMTLINTGPPGSTIMLVRLATRRISETHPITGLTNGPLFYKGRREGFTFSGEK